MTILVHHLEYSRSLRVLWLLEELGLDYSVQQWKPVSRAVAERVPTSWLGATASHNATPSSAPKPRAAPRSRNKRTATLVIQAVDRDLLGFAGAGDVAKGFAHDVDGVVEAAVGRADGSYAVGHA